MVVKKRNNSKILVNKKDVNSETRNKRSTRSKSKSQRLTYAYDGHTKSVEELRNYRGPNKRKLFTQLIKAVRNGDTKALKTVKKMRDHGMISNAIWKHTFGRQLLHTLTTVLSTGRCPMAKFDCLRFIIDRYRIGELHDKELLLSTLSSMRVMLGKRKTFPRMVHLILDMTRKEIKIPHDVIEELIRWSCFLWATLSFKLKIHSVKAIEACLTVQFDYEFNDEGANCYAFTETILRELKTPVNTHTHHLHEAVLRVTKFIFGERIVSKLLVPAFNVYLNRCEHPALLYIQFLVIHSKLVDHPGEVQFYASAPEYWDTYLRLCYHKNARVAKSARFLVLGLIDYRDTILPIYPKLIDQLKYGFLEVFRMSLAHDREYPNYGIEILVELAEEHSELHVYMRSHKLDELMAEMLENRWNDDPRKAATALRFIHLIEFKEDSNYGVIFPQKIY